MPVPNTRSRSRGARWQTLVALTALAGVLLWAKLRLVSNMPRSVYADPKPAVPRPDPRSSDAASSVVPGHAPSDDGHAENADGGGDTPASTLPSR